MGLDIRAYRNLQPIPGATVDAGGIAVAASGEELHDVFVAGPAMTWAETHWPGRAEGLDPGTVYRYDECFAFRAGSYSGYGDWRRLLRKLAGNRPFPFSELTGFADNEGVIGPVVSLKLAGDFASNAEQAKTHHPEPWFYDLYEKWRKAFETASQNGAVEFT